MAAFLVYGNVFGNDFLYDDEFLIQKNAFLRSWDSLDSIFLSSSTAGAGKADSFFRPVQTVLYLLVFQGFGLSTFAFHFLNVLLHALNGVLIFVLGRRLGLGLVGSWMGALLWCVHPVHTEAVAYMSATADPAHTAFVLLGLVVLLPEMTGLRAVAASLFFLLALLSKESAVVFPALITVCLFYLSPQRRDWRTYLPTLPFWLLAFGYLLARQTFLDFSDSFRFYETENIYTENVAVRIFTFLATLPEYLRILLYPSDLHIDRQFPVYASFFWWPVIGGLAVVAISVVAVVRGFGGQSVVFAWAILWFFAAYFPHTGILVPMNSMFLEHWLYLTTVGAFLAIGKSFSSDSNANSIWLTRSLTTAIVLALGVCTWNQNRIWSNSITLYEHILKFNPKAARVHNNLAMAYSQRGEIDKAIEHYQTAIATSDVYPESHHNLALALLSRGRIDEGIAHLMKAVEMNPDFYFSYEFLAKAHAMKGDRLKESEFKAKYENVRKKFLR